MYRTICGFCGGRKFWKLKGSQLRCKRCKHDRSNYPVIQVRLSSNEWRKLVEWYLVGANSPTLKEETGKSMGTIHKALRLVRQAMYLDIPEVFQGTVEVDETYIGGNWKNKRKQVKIKQPQSKRGRGTTKQPVFGILERNGKVWAELVNNTEAIDLIPIITKRVQPGTRVCSDTWRAYKGLAAKGYIHRTVNHSQHEYAKGKNHINGLEGFWGYLKRQLASKGGIRKKYLPLFLAEYVWRYNYRILTIKQQTDRLLAAIYAEFSARS